MASTHRCPLLFFGSLNFRRAAVMLFIITLSLTSATLSAQILRGVVVVQNSRTLQGQTQYVSGAQVSSPYAQTVVSDDSGRVALFVSDVKPGSVVPISVKLTGEYAGYEVLNESELSENILLGRVMLFEVYIGKKQELAQRTAELKKQLNAATTSEAARPFISIYVQHLINDNLDDHTPLYVRAYKNFEQGNFGKVSAILTDKVVEDLYQQARTVIAQSMQIVARDNSASDTLLLNVEKAQQDVNRSIQAWLLKARAAALSERRGDAVQYYESALKLDEQNYKNMFEFAQYLRNLNLLQKAEKYYLLTLKICEQRAKQHPTVYLPDLAAVQNDLANCYQKQGMLASAEPLYLNSLQAYESLADTSMQYRHALLLVLINLVDNYRLQHKTDLAENYYRRALDSCEHMVQQNAALYEPELASLLHSGGRFYNSQKQYDKAERAYRRSIALYEKLRIDNMRVFLPLIAATLYDLAVNYSDMNVYDQAEVAFKQSLDAYDVLIKVNPASYQPLLAALLNNIGNACYMQKKYKSSQDYMQRSVDVYTKLAAEQPELYASDLAMSLNNLANIYSAQNLYAQAQATYEQCYEQYRNLAQSNAATYSPNLFNVANMLAATCANQHDYRAAIRYTQQNIDLLNARKDTVTSQYIYHLAVNYGRMGLYNIFIKEFVAAEDCARKGIELDGSQLWIQAVLAHSLLLQKHYYFTEAEEMYRSLAKSIFQNNETYRQYLLDALNEFMQQGIIPPDRMGDVNKIREMLRDMQ